MESELVSDGSISGRNGKDRSSLNTNYTEYFERLCPYYLSLGMTYEQFWDGDSAMARMYRKAHDLKLEEMNFSLWLQGRYIYDALCCVSPILRAFSKAKKPIDYHEMPYALQTEYSEIRRKQKEQESNKKAKAMLEAFATKFNKKFLEKGGANNG